LAGILTFFQHSVSVFPENSKKFVLAVSHQEAASNYWFSTTTKKILCLVPPLRPHKQKYHSPPKN